jgi:hypothetical protein
MMIRIVSVLSLCLLLPSPTFAEKRVALVIGNSAYQHTPKLANPKNDATDMAAALKKLGFQVLDGFDLDKAAFDRKVRDFAVALQGAQAGVFFFAGHGLQVSGHNYLVPVDAQLSTVSALDFETVRLDLVHRTMEREAQANILFLDACRDNPLARNLARAMGTTRSIEIGRGLAAVESSVGTLISFSTQPGNVALDGTGRNSPFAGPLVKRILSSSDDLGAILIAVRNDVMKETQRKQVPWEHSALTGRFYFIPPKPGGHQIELEFWASVKDSRSPAVLGTYLERYPDGEFAPIARALVEHYERQRKVEAAAREEDLKREEEEKKAAQVRRLEEERRGREAAIAEERNRAEEVKSAAEIKRLDEQAKTEWLARTEDLRKALEEARLAREAAATAEKQRLEAAKAAELAMKAAEQTIAAKREAEKTGDPLKIAALPKLGNEGKRAEEDRKRSQPFDGTWHVRRIGPSCEFGQDVLFLIVINDRVVQGLSAGQQRIRGTLSASGQITFRHVSADRNNNPVGTNAVYAGSLKGTSGSGTFAIEGSRCKGTFTASRG